MAANEEKSELGLRFSQAKAEERSWLPWLIAGIVILACLGLFILFGGHSAGPASSAPGLATADVYAPNLTVSNVKMSEASNFAGGKVTYLDGKIANQGGKVLTGITVQVAFHNDLKEIAQKETLPLNLIRTREPYVDTQPVSAAPIKPGEKRDFRLIFDSVPPDWNQQYPEIRIVQVRGK